jgi:hypothetical protein
MVLVLTVFLSLSFAAGQEEPFPPSVPPGSAGEKSLRPIPLSPLLEIIAAGEIFWRPDWPEDFPPDAFSVYSGPPLSIVLEYGGDTLVLRRDREGRLREFPFYWDRAFIRFQADYDSAGRIQRLSAETPDWAADFPENFLISGDTGPVRVKHGGTWYFALVLEAGFGFSETWYDGEGNFAAWYQALVRRDGPSWRIRSLEFRGGGDQSREDYDYDSGGNITALNSPQGEFSAGYRNGRPVYWNRAPAPAAASVPAPVPAPAAASAPAPEDTAAEDPESLNAVPEQPGKFILQWDERGFLTARRPQEGERGGEFRYDYETGGRGDWTKRRDTELLKGDDLFIPVFRGQYERRIFYTEE